MYVFCGAMKSGSWDLFALSYAPSRQLYLDASRISIHATGNAPSDETSRSTANNPLSYTRSHRTSTSDCALTATQHNKDSNQPAAQAHAQRSAVSAARAQRSSPKGSSLQQRAHAVSRPNDASAGVLASSRQLPQAAAGSEHEALQQQSTAAQVWTSLAPSD